jgi:hypothetical protein
MFKKGSVLFREVVGIFFKDFFPLRLSNHFLYYKVDEEGKRKLISSNTTIRVTDIVPLTSPLLVEHEATHNYCAPSTITVHKLSTEL